MKKIIAVLAALTIIFSAAVPAFGANSQTSNSKTPKAPRLAKAKNVSDGVFLRWGAVKNAVKYYVYRRTSTVKYQKIATVKKTSFTHKSAVSGKKYTYKVYAVGSKGKSKSSNKRTITRVGTPKLKTSNTAYAVKLSWGKVKKATSYVLLYKKSSAKKYTVLYRGKKLSYINDNIGSGVTYDFKIRASIGKAKGAYCQKKSQMFLESPTLSAEELVDMKGITLKWSSVKNAKGYIIYRSLKSNNSYTRIAKTTTDSTKYVDSKLVSINSYKYYVLAYNGSYKSARSNIDGDVYGYLESPDAPLYLTIKKGEVYTDIYDKLSSYGATPLITWQSANTKIVKVTTDGIITGVKKGSASLKATIDPSLATMYGYTLSGTKTITIVVTVK